MIDSPIVEVAIGLFFLFAIMSTITSAIAESISRFIGLRGTYLLKGLRSLVDGESGGASTQLIGLFENSRILQSQGSDEANISDRLRVDQHKRKWSVKRSLPSYIPGRSFVAAIMRRVTPGDGSSAPNMSNIVAGINGLDDGVLKDQLRELARSAAGSVETFKENVGSWYDDHMDRVSGWYKRRIRTITGIIGGIVVIGLNIQLFAFAQALYDDETFRDSTVAQAVAASACDDEDLGECLKTAREDLEDLQPGLQLSWARVDDCAGTTCNFLQAHGFSDPVGGTGDDIWRGATVVLGWIVLIFAMLPGSRFWFDLVNRFNSMRLTGPKPYPGSKPTET
jgi:hypothetical protein